MIFEVKDDTLGVGGESLGQALGNALRLASPNTEVLGFSRLSLRDISLGWAFTRKANAD